MMANIFQVQERETDDKTVIKLFYCVKTPPTVLWVYYWHKAQAPLYESTK